MKLKLVSVDHNHEQMQRTNRNPYVYPPPDDGREWMLVDEAAALFDIKPRSMMNKAVRLDITRTCHRGVKAWLLKQEVIKYLEFVKDRQRWWRRRDPKHWQPQIGFFSGYSDEKMQSFLWTAKQAAEYMGVGVSVISFWARSGKIPVFHNGKMGKGYKHWYSPTAMRHYKENEERLKGIQAYEKGCQTLRAGTVYDEVYDQQHRPRVFKDIPLGWITVREAAEILGVSRRTVRKLCRRKHVTTKHFTGEWDAKHHPWFISQVSLEEYMETDLYKRKHREGIEAIQKRRGIVVSPSDTEALLPPREFSGITPIYTREEWEKPHERITGYIPNPDLW